MDKRNLLDNIIYPFGSEYQTGYIKVYYSLNDELKDMIERSGYKKIFLTKYRNSLRYLENLKTRCCLGNSSLFEKLLDEDNLYSIMILGEKNIRILFFFVSIDCSHKAILLNVFEEKSTSDYESGKRIAKIRKTEIVNIINS